MSVYGYRLCIVYMYHAWNCRLHGKPAPDGVWRLGFLGAWHQNNAYIMRGKTTYVPKKSI